jgi:hypothetical protein
MFSLTSKLSWFSVAAVCLAAGTALAGSKITVGQAVAANQRVSMDQVDHNVWDTLLKRYVNAVGNVDYTAWQRSAADVRALDGYLNTLSQADRGIRAGKESRLAFWINAYNALTIKGILREYPTTSIRNHTPRLYGYKHLERPAARCGRRIAFAGTDRTRSTSQDGRSLFHQMLRP